MGVAKAFTQKQYWEIKKPDQTKSQTNMEC